MDIKLSDWIAINEIEEAIDKYRSGDETDYETLLKIKEILNRFGFLKER
jgi:hypothetical protein